MLYRNVHVKPRLDFVWRNSYADNHVMCCLSYWISATGVNWVGKSCANFHRLASKNHFSSSIINHLHRVPFTTISYPQQFPMISTSYFPPIAAYFSYFITILHFVYSFICLSFPPPCSLCFVASTFFFYLETHLIWKLPVSTSSTTGNSYLTYVFRWKPSLAETSCR